MLLGKISKELICSVKDPELDSSKIFIVMLLNKDLSEKDNYMVAVETGLSLGVGDIVLMVFGSCSRKVKGNENMPIDCAITARVETINIEKGFESL